MYRDWNVTLSTTKSHFNRVYLHIYVLHTCILKKLTYQVMYLPKTQFYCCPWSRNTPNQMERRYHWNINLWQAGGCSYFTILLRVCATHENDTANIVIIYHICNDCCSTTAILRSHSNVTFLWLHIQPC